MAQNGPHQRTIDALVAADPQMKTHGLWKAIRALIEELPTAELEEFTLRSFVPDAYKIDHETKTIKIYEVEHTNRLSQSKIDAIVWFWFEWDADDYDDWTVEAYVQDCHGTLPRQLNLVDLYHDFVDRSIARERSDNS